MFKINEKITLYHGSYLEVTKPEIAKCRENKDFGKGFYLTLNKQQAERFANTSKIRNEAAKAIVNTYELTLHKEDKVLFFEKPTKTWFKYVASNRSKNKKLNPINEEYDVVVGKIADDATAQVINLFLVGAYGKTNSEQAISFAIKQLVPNRLADQICIKSQKTLNNLKFIKAEECSHE